MALAFRDFTPRQMTPARHGSPAQWEPVAGLVQRADQWLASAGLRALNVETLQFSLNKNGQPISSVSGSAERWDEDHVWVQVVRVWYETPNAPVNTPPALASNAPGTPVL
jgi:hypothetical protein